MERGALHGPQPSWARAPKHGVLAVAHRPKIGERLCFACANGERSRDDLKATLEALVKHMRLG